MIENVMIKKITLCILAFLLFMPFSNATELEIAQRKLNNKSLTLFADTAGYKVYEANNGGFCIVRDTCVVAYSLQSFITESTLESVVFPKKKMVAHKKIYENIKPLLSDIKFNQHSPYNDSLPLLNEKKCYTGCLPVALAQVMKYYNYPPFTTADIPGFKTKTAGLDMHFIPKTTRFDWQNIVPCYKSEDNEEKKAAVAFLMKVVCTSCYTDLNVDASPTYTDNAYKALVEYFGYDNNKIHVIKSCHYSLTRFEELIYKELSRQRPVLLGNSNHAFVCDGYEDGLFHANWGWGGLMNGYFDISLLAPERREDKYGFGDALDATLGVVPNIGDTDIPMTVNLWVSNFNDPHFQETLTPSGEVKGSILCSVHSNTYKEITSHVNVGYLGENGKWVLIGDNDFVYTGKYGYGIGQGIRICCKLNENTTYRIVPLEKCEGKDWEPMENSYYNYFDLSVENGKVKVLLPQKHVIKANASFVNQEDGKYVKLDLSNSGYDDFCDTFYVKLNDMEECLAKQELIVPANGNTSVMYKYADSTLLSKYEVKVFDANQSLLAVANYAPNKMEDNIIAVNKSAQDSASVDEVSKISKPIDPESLSVTAISLGLMLVILLFIFVKIFG